MIARPSGWSAKIGVAKHVEEDLLLGIVLV